MDSWKPKLELITPTSSSGLRIPTSLWDVIFNSSGIIEIIELIYTYPWVLIFIYWF
jgi:hypothetical protein